jgi:hypothetical protein
MLAGSISRRVTIYDSHGTKIKKIQIYYCIKDMGIDIAPITTGDRSGRNKVQTIALSQP